MGVKVLVDGENVRRSRWPNVSAEQLVELCAAWAAANDADVVVVFDGPAPGELIGEREVDARTVVAGAGAESADDWLVRRARELAAGGEDVWLVSSDRELRVRVGDAAARVIGGGSFVRELDDAPKPT